MESQVDTNLYSRQIGTFGMETMSKLIQLKVLLIGLRGLGVETAKNIILAGPKSVTIYDPSITIINDLGANFFLSLSDVGKTRRDVACLSKLAELNPYVNVSIMEGDDILSKVTDFHIVVITEIMDKDLLIKIDSICRENKVAFIHAAAFGISGYCFVDMGKEHYIRDRNGEECKTYITRFITKDEVGAVTIDDTFGNGLNLFKGDTITFREVQGMTELNDGQPRTILKILSPISFSIGDTRGLSDYKRGGIIEQVKIPQKMEYKSLGELFDHPYSGKAPDPMDFSKVGRNQILHCAFLALHDYYQKNKMLPELNNEEQAKMIVAKAKEIFTNGRKNKEQWLKRVQKFNEKNEKLVCNIGKWARAQISPICAFLGGVVAQEIVKLTGKYTPMNQWLWFDFFETIANIKDDADRTLKGSRYDDQIAIYGNEIQNQLGEANVFMIGAGALGCEFLKNFALMGISIKESKEVVVTDNDNIEVSNLNRQFLFRKDNVGNSKSKCACEAIRKMNSDFNCRDLQSRIGEENEHIFDEEFWSKQTFVINAVDNINARKYIDNQCTLFHRPLIDSGTLGTKAHVQMIIPNITSCYNDTEDPPEESIPMCTLHNFPAMIEHCIEWGRDLFNGYFTDVITEAKKFIENSKQFYEDLKKEGNSTLQLIKLKNIKDHVKLAVENNFDNIIRFAVMQYTENFQYKIAQLLYNFPPEYKNKDGSLFWSGTKRVPHIIKYDPNDPLALMFVKNYAIILARALSVKSNNDDNYIKEISSKVEIPNFVPKKVKIKVSDDEKEEEAEVDQSAIKDEDEMQLISLMQDLSIYDPKSVDPSKFKPEEFEKDDDANGHIDFIHSSSNIRARNYTIKECDRQKTKMIAGRIVPAIATTTAAITGIVSLQLYTLLQTHQLQYIKNCFINLAVDLFVLTEPAEKNEMEDVEYDESVDGPIKAVPPKWTVWDKINVNQSMTVGEFVAMVKKDYNVDVNAITSKETTIVQMLMKSSKQRMGQKIEDVYNEHSKVKLPPKQKYLLLEVGGDIGGVIANMPQFKYNFKQ